MALPSEVIKCFESFACAVSALNRPSGQHMLAGQLVVISSGRPLSAAHCRYR